MAQHVPDSPSTSYIDLEQRPPRLPSVVPVAPTATTRLVLVVKHDPAIMPESVQDAIVASFAASPDYTLEEAAILP